MKIFIAVVLISMLYSGEVSSLEWMDEESSWRWLDEHCKKLGVLDVTDNPTALYTVNKWKCKDFKPTRISTVECHRLCPRTWLGTQRTLVMRNKCDYIGLTLRITCDCLNRVK
ncbi:uncharacterized protein LOC144429877 [Styela clava]